MKCFLNYCSLGEAPQPLRPPRKGGISPRPLMNILNKAPKKSACECPGIEHLRPVIPFPLISKRRINANFFFIPKTKKVIHTASGLSLICKSHPVAVWRTSGTPQETKPYVYASASHMGHQRRLSIVVDLIVMQLTDERFLELLGVPEARLSGGTRFTENSSDDLTNGKVFVTRINSQHTVMPSEQIKRCGNMARLRCEICLAPFVTPGWLKRKWTLTTRRLGKSVDMKVC